MAELAAYAKQHIPKEHPKVNEEKQNKFYVINQFRMKKHFLMNDEKN